MDLPSSQYKYRFISRILAEAIFVEADILKEL